ncbi:MAG: hypothetical protein JST01_23265 [Cyanobacteria bacterium SZAS TMP-1]|nr:hypothetical protein [Cyanobacteria bacterium SZAS TMP-1]
MEAIRGLGKSGSSSAVRSGADLAAQKDVEGAAAALAASEAVSKEAARAAAEALASGERERLARISDHRLPAQTEKGPKNKDQWNKLKQTARENEPASGVVDHWAQKSSAGGILSGTAFDAATTDVANGPRAHKRPTMVSQARITHSRLQALQAQIDGPKNEFDKTSEKEAGEDSMHPGHGH